MSEFDVLVTGGFILAVFGLVRLFGALVDGRSLVVPGLIVILASGSFFLALEESPTGQIKAQDIPNAMLRIVRHLAG